MQRSGQPLIVWFFVWDLLITAGAWLAAHYVRFYTFLPADYPSPTPISVVISQLPLVLFMAAIAFRFVGQYRINRLRRFREDMVSVIQGVVLWMLLLQTVFFYAQEQNITRGAMALAGGIAILALTTMRRISWAGLRYLRRRGHNQSFAIIVGTGRRARMLDRSLRKANWLGVKNLGFIEDQRSHWSTNLDVLGGIADLPKLIDKYNIEHVFIALPLKRFNESRKVFEALAEKVVDVRLAPDLPELSGLSLTTTALDGQMIIGLRESPHHGLNVWMKRMMDVVLSAIGLIVLSPILIIVAILVKVTSPGPIFFRQERCGLNGRSFWMLKFRSMRADADKAEKENGPMWTRKDDDRRTKFGTFIRKTSIDELPQLINVLLGDMSLVGPRPERPVFVNKFTKTIPGYMARHSVKAGITGWAQVNGWRGNTSLRKRIQYDLYYITHWNPWFDLRIMFLTVFRICFQRHAY